MINLMTKVNFSILSKLALQNCEPLYFSHPFLQDGHSACKANATITYLKHRGVLYGITCAHVFHHQFDENGLIKKVLTVWGDRLAYQFGSWAPDGYQSHFRLLKNNYDPSGTLDIAIIRLPGLFSDLHMKKKRKAPIDLDEWEEPDWSSISTLMVSGFPTEHKEQTDTHVEAYFLQVVAELTQGINADVDKFLLASTLPKKNDYFFSGMSGGPVYCIKPDTTLTAVGIVFEGSPGSSTEWEKRGDDSFLSKEDVQFRAYLLTPSIFSNWICQAGFA